VLSQRLSTTRGTDTNDGLSPTCPDIIALRHPEFGNYTPAEISRRYFNAHNTSYMRLYIGQFEGMVWLLSDESKWLLDKIHEMLIPGMSQNDQWVSDAPKTEGNILYRLMSGVPETDFS
jgi:hypothetical protein